MPPIIGLFYRIAGAIHVAGSSIIDARIHTTRDGMALDNFLIQDPLGRPFDEGRRGSTGSRRRSPMRWPIAPSSRTGSGQAAGPRSRQLYTIEPNVLIDNNASNRFTVIEINARDRPALLCPTRPTAVPVEGDDPFGACRHLWRARGRYLLSDRPDRR